MTNVNALALATLSDVVLLRCWPVNALARYYTDGSIVNTPTLVMLRILDYQQREQHRNLITARDRRQERQRWPLTKITYNQDQQFRGIRHLPRNLLLGAEKRGIACFCNIYIQFKVFGLLFNFTAYKTIKSSRCKLTFMIIKSINGLMCFPITGYNKFVILWSVVS